MNVSEWVLVVFMVVLAGWNVRTAVRARGLGMRGLFWFCVATTVWCVAWAVFDAVLAVTA